jgi:hypothetical protein
MKRKLVAIGLLAGGFALTRASSGAAAVERIEFRGAIAELNLFQEAATTCEDGTSGLLHTSISIELSRDGVRSSLGNSDGRSLLLFFSQFDTCTGVVRDVVAFDQPAEYTQNGVRSASFADSFDLIDELSGDLIGTLAFDVQLTGTGETEHDDQHSTSASGDFVFHSHFHGIFRAAAASGTVSLDGIELIDAGQFATLSDLHSGNITVTH